MSTQIRTAPVVSGTARGRATTRALLRCGVVAGPLYLVVGYAQALTRDGFDLTRHPFSSLSLGGPGWIQIANFVVSGALFIAAAVGIRRALRGKSGGTWGSLLIAAMGVGMIGGGVFVADLALGFPAGAPAGQPDTLSWHGMLHAAAFVVAFVSWTAACFVFARRFARNSRRGWAAYCAATGVALLVPLAFFGSGPGVVLLYVAATVGWTWTSALTGRLLAELRSS